MAFPIVNLTMRMKKIAQKVNPYFDINMIPDIYLKSFSSPQCIIFLPFKIQTHANLFHARMKANVTQNMGNGNVFAHRDILVQIVSMTGIHANMFNV